MIVPGCSGGIDTPDYTDRNPFWYAFTAFRGGPLTFTITPFNAGDDYDWQLYDVTNVSNINDVYSNPSLVVTGNWAGTYGATGASASGVTYIQCASIPEDNAPSFARSPVLIQGHNNLLMVSHLPLRKVVIPSILPRAHPTSRIPSPPNCKKLQRPVMPLH